MGKNNELPVGRTRIGWYEDGLANHVTPPTGTLLENTGDRVQLTIPWMSSRPIGQVERWFHGAANHCSDDPDQGRYTYAVPEELLFHDSYGSVVLIGCSDAGFHSKMSGPGEGRVEAAGAVLGAARFGYSNVNGLRSTMPGLGRWFGMRAVNVSPEVDHQGRNQALTIDVRSPGPVQLSRRLNASLSSHWSVTPSQDEETSVLDRSWITTRVKRTRPWTEHLEVHNLLRDLVAFSCWRPHGYRALEVLRDDDPKEEIPGQVRDRWLPVVTHRVPALQEPHRRTRFVFTFPTIGSRGVGRWLTINSKYERVMVPFLGLLRAEKPFIETMVMQSSLALEALGYHLFIDDGSSERQAADSRLKKRLRRVLDDLPITMVADDWVSLSADVYNGVKHANRLMPATADMQDAYQANVLVLTAWVTHRLGIPDASLHRTVSKQRFFEHLQSREIAYPSPTD